MFTQPAIICWFCSRAAKVRGCRRSYPCCCDCEVTPYACEKQQSEHAMLWAAAQHHGYVLASTGALRNHAADHAAADDKQFPALLWTSSARRCNARSGLLRIHCTTRGIPGVLPISYTPIADIADTAPPLPRVQAHAGWFTMGVYIYAARKLLIMCTFASLTIDRHWHANCAATEESPRRWLPSALAPAASICWIPWTENACISSVSGSDGEDRAERMKTAAAAVCALRSLKRLTVRQCLTQLLPPSFVSQLPSSTQVG